MRGESTRWGGRSEKAELESQQGETVEGLSHQAKEPGLFCEQKGARNFPRQGAAWAGPDGISMAVP